MDRRAFIKALTIITGSATLALASGLPAGPVLAAVDESITETMGFAAWLPKVGGGAFFGVDRATGSDWTVVSPPMFASRPSWERVKPS
jgi:hypothetical protein